MDMIIDEKAAVLDQAMAVVEDRIKLELMFHSEKARDATIDAVREND